jgi:hypothetical protein
LIGAFVSNPLNGSLLVVLVFAVDVFSGPQMTSNSLFGYTPTRDAANLLIAAGRATRSGGGAFGIRSCSTSATLERRGLEGRQGVAVRMAAAAEPAPGVHEAILQTGRLRVLGAHARGRAGARRRRPPPRRGGRPR